MINKSTTEFLQAAEAPSSSVNHPTWDVNCRESQSGSLVNFLKFTKIALCIPSTNGMSFKKGQHPLPSVIIPGLLSLFQVESYLYFPILY